jgi:hypothetical protein
MAASPNIVSCGNSMKFTQSEATAAQRTWLFYLSNSADGTPATGKTISGADFRISKNGAAFANAAGTVTELALGWYTMVFAVADLDTLGVLACEISGEAGVDALHVSHQITLFDHNVATVALTDGSLTAAKFATDSIAAAAIAADAVSELQSGLATSANVDAVDKKVRNTTHALGTITGASGNSTGVSMKDATKAVITATGTFDSGTITVQVCADPQAAAPVWVDVAGATLTANGSKTINGPANAVRARLSGATAATVVVTAEISRPI